MINKKSVDFIKRILSCSVLLVGGSLFCVLFFAITVLYMATSLIWELTDYLVRKIEGS